MSNWLITILNGPNLSQLGKREPEIYGSVTYDDLVTQCSEWGGQHGHQVTVRQTDSEGELVQLIQDAAGDSDGLIINAAAYTHTSVAVRDALAAVDLPVVELHISNPWSREPFRQQNYLSDVVTAGIHGFGTGGYLLALTGLMEILSKKNS